MPNSMCSKVVFFTLGKSTVKLYCGYPCNNFFSAGVCLISVNRGRVGVGLGVRPTIRVVCIDCGFLKNLFLECDYS